MIPVQFVVKQPGAILPSYQSKGAAAVDLHAYLGGEGGCTFTLYPGQTKKISTGIAFYIGDRRYAMVILPRSGLGSKGIILANTIGLVDSDYQGELVVMLYNRSKEPFVINQGDRIAQAMFMPVVHADFMRATSFSETTERGEGGFGSTGLMAEAV